jgi:hypothetical protein
VLGTAGNSSWTYALLGSCRATGCTYRLARRDPFGVRPAWLPLRNLPSPPDVDGRSAELVALGEDTVAVLEKSKGRGWVSDDGGIHFRAIAVLPGRALPAVPAGLTPELGGCAGCAGQVGVFDPATGRRGRLAVQPPLTPPPSTFAESGGVLWAASATRRAITVAVSTDRGRTWRTRTLPASAPRSGAPLLVADGSRAYLVLDRPDGRPEAQVWVTASPTAPWRRLEGDQRMQSVTGAVVAGDSLLVCADGGFFRQRGGRIAPVTPPAGGSMPFVDGLATGAPSVVVAHIAYARGSILVSSDGGETWQVEALPD